MKKVIKKLTKKTGLAILAIIVIAIPVIYLTVLNQKPVSASWPARNASASVAGGMDENWRMI